MEPRFEIQLEGECERIVSDSASRSKISEKGYDIRRLRHVFCNLRRGHELEHLLRRARSSCRYR